MVTLNTNIQIERVLFVFWVVVVLTVQLIVEKVCLKLVVSSISKALTLLALLSWEAVKFLLPVLRSHLLFFAGRLLGAICRPRDTHTRIRAFFSS